MALTKFPEFDRERFISEVYRAELDSSQESEEYIAWREVELIPSIPFVQDNFFFHYKFALFSLPKATDEKLRSLHLEVEKEMLNHDISLLLMKAELSRFATSFTIAGRCELCHLSLLSTTGAGPSSMRNQDQYAVIHISCFPANYSENLLRRHFSIEFVTLTVYTNRSGMYKLFLHPLRSSLRSHYGFII